MQIDRMPGAMIRLRENGRTEPGAAVFFPRSVAVLPPGCYGESPCRVQNFGHRCPGDCGAATGGSLFIEVHVEEIAHHQ